MKPITFETKRLILRQWNKSDKTDFAYMCANPEVMRYFPHTLSVDESYAMAERIISLIDENGWGLWALELKSTGEFIGFTGLHKPQADLPFTPCVEIGWRLAHKYWGNGYAPEAASQALYFAFTQLDLAQVLSFTTVQNYRSQAVMAKIGMKNTNHNFLHPDVPPESELQEHVLYRITQTEWRNKYKKLYGL